MKYGSFIPLSETDVLEHLKKNSNCDLSTRLVCVYTQTHTHSHTYLYLSADKRTYARLRCFAPSCACDRKSPAATRPGSDVSSSSSLLAGPLGIHSFLQTPAPPRLPRPRRLSHHLTSKGPRRVSLFTLPSRRSLQKHQNKPCGEAGRINDLPVPPVPRAPRTAPGRLEQNKYARRVCVRGRAVRRRRGRASSRTRAHTHTHTCALAPEPTAANDLSISGN